MKSKKTTLDKIVYTVVFGGLSWIAITVYIFAQQGRL